MVNWDPAARTALSDEEVVFKESHGKLYYLRYAVEGTDKYLVVATTRPETILGDTALCVNPDDERYEWLPQDARVVVPLVGRSIPVIRDTYVDIAFGTGALKVTPAHDVNDYMLGEKYGLETIDIFNDDGTINGKVGIYEGMDRFELRRVIEGDLQRAGLLEKTEEYTNNVGYSERTGVAIEPKLSMQWFLSMEELAKPATRAVMEDEIRFVPEKYKNIYRHWMENIKDWCISRQLWSGTAHPGLLPPRAASWWPDGRGGAGEGPREDGRRLAESGRSPAGRGRARHVVLVVALADLRVRRHPQPRQQGNPLLLPHRRPGDRPGHHLLLGGADDLLRPGAHGGGALQDRVLPRPAAGLPGPEDEQVFGQRHRPRGRHQPVRRPTLCALPWSPATPLATTPATPTRRWPPAGTSPTRFGTPPGLST